MHSPFIPMAEEQVLKTSQCQFESDKGYHLTDWNIMQSIIISSLIHQGFERRNDLEELIFDTLAVKTEVYSLHVEPLEATKNFVFWDHGVKSLRADIELADGKEDDLIPEFVKLRQKWLDAN